MLFLVIKKNRRVHDYYRPSVLSVEPNNRFVDSHIAHIVWLVPTKFKFTNLGCCSTHFSTCTSSLTFNTEMCIGKHDPEAMTMRPLNMFSPSLLRIARVHALYMNKIGSATEIYGYTNMFEIINNTPQYTNNNNTVERRHPQHFYLTLCLAYPKWQRGWILGNTAYTAAKPCRAPSML